MRKSFTILGASILAPLLGAIIFLRAKPSARDELPAPTRIPPAARQVIRTKMNRHENQMRSLLSRAVLLDDDGVARIAGEIFDEPALARPLTGSELNGLLPERFFVLQDEIKSRARRVVVASQRRDHAALADEIAGVMKGCIACHDAYLNDGGGTASNRGARE